MWTNRLETQVTCGGDLGAVSDDETIARLLLVQNPPSGWRPFKLPGFLPPSSGPISNTCGDSDGGSVDRANTLTGDDLQNRSNSFAAVQQAAAEARAAETGKPNKIVRSGGGSLVATVGVLRTLTVTSQNDAQVVYIYADPRADNAEHAVVRISTAVLEEELPLLYDDITAGFK